MPTPVLPIVWSAGRSFPRAPAAVLAIVTVLAVVKLAVKIAVEVVV